MTPTLDGKGASQVQTPLSADFRSVDGLGNNLAHPDWGSAGTDLIRIAPPAYADGVSAPREPIGPPPA